MIVEIEDDVTFEPNYNNTQFLTPIEERLLPYAITLQEIESFREQTGKHWPSPREMKTMFNKNVFIFGINTTNTQAANYSIDTQMNIQFPNNDAKFFEPDTCNGLTPNFTIFGESGIRVVLHILNFNITDDGRVEVGYFTRPTGIAE